jgi:hypothetical protein
VIAVFFIPMFFYVIESFSERFDAKRPESGPASGGAVGPQAVHAPNEEP